MKSRTGAVARAEELVFAHLPPLAARAHARLVRDLVERMCALGPVTNKFAGLSPPAQLLELVHFAMRAVAALHDDSEQHERAFALLGTQYFAPNADRRRVAIEYLKATVADDDRRRGDVAALDRWLDFSALGERHQTAQRTRSIGVELALHFIGSAAAFVIAEASIARLLAQTRVDDFLVEQVVRQTRWQNRVAALEALTRLVRSGADGADDVVGARIRPALAALMAPQEHVFVQTAALSLATALQPADALATIERRLLGVRPDARLDFVVRRFAVDAIARGVRSTAGLALLVRVAAARDPSDHVRMGVAAALAALVTDGDPATDARAVVDALARIGDPDGDDGEPSAKVRAAVVRALAAVAQHPGIDDDARTRALDVLAGRVRRERDTRVLLVAGDVIVASPSRFAGHRPLASALRALIDDDARPFAVHDAARTALDALDGSMRPGQTAWAALLSEVVAALPTGSSCVVQTSSLPADVRDDAAALGCALQALARDDFGLEAELAPERHRVVLWRGDVKRRRLWRVLHELRNPSPAKRQAHPHTVGRVRRGHLRAPPGKLAEVTATTVPGERVIVDSEGGWGRYLPTIDDLLALDLFAPRPVEIFSAHGITTLHPPASLAARLRARWTLSTGYAAFASLRLASLAGREPRERERFVATLAQRLGLLVTFRPHVLLDGSSPMSSHVAALFPLTSTNDVFADAPPPAPPPTTTTVPTPAITTLAGFAPVFEPMAASVVDWMARHESYFVKLSHNSQPALAVFAATVLTWFLFEAYRKRRGVTQHRRQLPLSIGGWGTRGKSGTERLKEGLFHGLGYEVLVKTTGCEAMLIHALPDQPPLEVFIFRPYDKATIWEQRDMLELAARLRVEVFLWECMALNPKYVELLAHDWMRDDYTTLTNAYPDHEDIQGPAGDDVAEVIARFTPWDGTLLTSEIEFLPVFRHTAGQRRSRLIAVRERQELEIADDLLKLFPYDEHPRNVALVASLAEELGLDRWLSIAMMADHVIPDLGVLKTYPDVRVRGRTMRFLNGMSANERTGTINNWRRMGLDRVDLDAEPERVVVTVVNNRADRVSRSEVFSRILVQDLVADRHVLIGTNLHGLLGFIRNAIDAEVARLEVAVDADRGASSLPAEARLARLMARLRIPAPSSDPVLARLACFARGAHRALSTSGANAVAARVEALLADAHERALDPDAARALVDADAALRAALVEGLVADAAPHASAGQRADRAAPPEALAPADVDEVIAHFGALLARVLVHASLRGRLRSALAPGVDDAALQTLHVDLRACYRALFLAQLVVIEEASTSGDRIIERCATSVPPGTDVTVMGIQNIKGTGLDFVYRWVAFDKTSAALRVLRHGGAVERTGALREIEATRDFGFLDTGTARAALRDPHSDESDSERALRERVLRQLDERHALKVQALAQRGSAHWSKKALPFIEASVDFLDSIRRSRTSRRVIDDLVEQRIAHAQAAIEMRALYARQQGGWLARQLARHEPPSTPSSKPRFATLKRLARETLRRRRAPPAPRPGG